MNEEMTTTLEDRLSLSCEAGTLEKTECTVEYSFPNAPDVTVKTTVKSGGFLSPFYVGYGPSLRYRVSPFVHDAEESVSFKSKIDTKSHSRQEIIDWVKPMIKEALATADSDGKLEKSRQMQRIADSYR